MSDMEMVLLIETESVSGSESVMEMERVIDSGCVSVRGRDRVFEKLSV